MRSWRDERGFTIVEVLVAAAILVIGVVGVSGAFSVAFTDVVASSGESKATAYARQQMEVLRNQPYSTTAAGADVPEPQFNRNWNTVVVPGTLPPNQVVTITVTVTWRQGWSRSKTIILQTNRMQWG
jgi:prepilin-type N-terminal cleavage/methylation domain-containing protein